MKTSKSNRVAFYLSLALIPVLTLIGMELVAAGAWIAYHKLHTGSAIEDHYFRFYVTRFLLPEAGLPPEGRYAGNITASPFANRAWHVADPVMGWRVGGGLLVTYDRHNRNWYASNPQGFASSGDAREIYQRPKPSGVLRFAILGGSTVEGRETNSPRDNLPAKLSALLKQSGSRGTRIEVINAGVGGFDSGHELLYLLTEIAHYQPDVLIVYDGWNDMMYNPVMGQEDFPLRYWQYPDYARRINASYEFGGALRNLATATASNLRAVMDQTVMGYLAQRVIGGAEDGNQEPSLLIKERQYSVENVERYRFNLELMRRVAAQYQSRTAFFLQPIMGVDGKDYSSNAVETRTLQLIEKEIPKRQHFYDHARRMFAELRSAFAGDPDVCVADVSRATAGYTEHLYKDSGHLIGAGNEIMARQIVARLTECGFLRN